MAITSQRIPAPGAADTGGHHPVPNPDVGRAPRPQDRRPARGIPNSGSQSRGEYQRLAPPALPAPPRPRAASAPTSRHARAAAAAPPPPPLLGARRPYRRLVEAHAVRRRRSNHLQKRHGVPAPQERATRRRPARFAAAASRSEIEAHAAECAARAFGEDEPAPRNLPRRRTPTRPSLGGDVEELTEQGCR